MFENKDGFVDVAFDWAEGFKVVVKTFLDIFLYPYDFDSTQIGA